MNSVVQPDGSPRSNGFRERLKSDWHLQVLFGTVILLIVFTGSLSYIALFSVETENPFNVQALFFGLLIVACTVLSVILARILNGDRWDILDNVDDKKSNDSRVLCRKFRRRAEATRNILFSLSALYAGFYTYIMWSVDFSDGAGTYFIVCLIASLAVGAMNYFFISSIDFNSRLLVLEHFSVTIDQPTTSEDDLRREVFAASQVYEPAGNIFVLIGIGTTFLSLSFGLITLDPRQILAAEVVALQKFIACMGLALGVSVLGIIAAVLSQYMRAASASKPTEDILEEASTSVQDLRNPTTNQVSNLVPVQNAARPAAETETQELPANDASQ